VNNAVQTEKHVIPREIKRPVYAFSSSTKPGALITWKATNSLRTRIGMEMKQKFRTALYANKLSSYAVFMLVKVYRVSLNHASYFSENAVDPGIK